MLSLSRISPSLWLLSSFFLASLHDDPIYGASSATILNLGSFLKGTPKECIFGVTPASLVDGCSKHGLMYTTSNNQYSLFRCFSKFLVTRDFPPLLISLLTTSKHGISLIAAITLLIDLAIQGLTATVQASAPGGRKDAKLTGLAIRMKTGQLLFYMAQWLEDVLTPTSPMSFHLNYRLPCPFLSSY
ncbi:unnamed protein product [Sphagnum balticum]